MLLALVCSIYAEDHSGKKQSKLVLIGIDGLRHDFYKLARNLPNLFAIARNGVRGTAIPPFPSNTLSAWATVMNGLYVESHGLTDHFYNPATDEVFQAKDGNRGEASKKFNYREPIWRTNERQGGTHHSIKFYWIIIDVVYVSFTFF